jgi:DNA invertase Pin-like site-specific DNA recombinase
MEAGFYGRVSGDSEESVEMQLALAREFAARDGYFIPERNVYTDVRVSGAREDRPGFMRLEADVVRGVLSFDRLFVRDRQRFARWLNPRLFGYYIVLFEKNGLGVRFCDVERHVDFKDGVTDADIGLFLMEQVENITNAKERTDIGRKMRRARRQHMINGAWPAGSWPFAVDRVLVNEATGEVECFVPWGQKLIRPGFRYELRFATDRRIETVKLIFQRIEEGASLRGVATELSERQLPHPRPAI